MAVVQALLSVESITKVYSPSVVALKNATFEVFPGTIHGLVGANGAGKSTLIKILSGALSQTLGKIVFAGDERRWTSPAEALSAGIATIYQHIPLAPTLTVAENVFLRSNQRWRRSRLERELLDSLLDELGYELDPDALVSELPIGTRQMISILQALAADARLIIMDEPTASLSDSERQIVFATVRRLKQTRGIAFIFISHFLDEILDLCEYVTVLRDGETVLDATRAELDEGKLIAAIVGHEATVFGKPPNSLPPDQPVLLTVSDLRPLGRRPAASFCVRAGEIVGLAGLLGSGRSEILHAISGADGRATGSVSVAGQLVRRTIAAGEAAGIVLVPEDRNDQALFVEKSIRWNTALPRVREVSHLGFIPSHDLEEKYAHQVIRTFSIKTSDSEVLVGHLSGGNAQKVALSRALSPCVRVLLLDEPTAGVDIGAKAEIRVAVESLTAGGAAVVVVLSDFEELLSMCHRVFVLDHGQIVAERNARETNEHELIGLASGLFDKKANHDPLH